MNYSNYEDRGYYENPGNGYFPGESPPPKRKRDWVAYLVTAIVFLIVGILIASLVNITSNNRYGGNTPAPTGKNVQTASPGLSVTATPSAPATPRPQAQYDGQLPIIYDNVNPIPDIVDQLISGVVGIINYGYSDKYGTEYEQGSGSGFVVSSEGYIVTNAHLVEDAARIAVMFSEDSEIETELIGLDKPSDIAVLKIDRRYVTKVLALGDSAAVRVGEFVIAIGDPTGRDLAGTTTFGIISATARSVNIDGRTNDYIQTDAAINPGNSGGPLLNMRGEVIGITSAKTITASYDTEGNPIAAEGLGFAIPINDAMKIVNQLIVSGAIQRPGIGITVSTVNEMQSDYYDMPQGVRVVSVIEGGPGDQAGLRASDVIVACNGETMLDQDGFVEVVQACRVGDTLKLSVWRSRGYLDVTVIVGDLNSIGSTNAGDEEPEFRSFG